MGRVIGIGETILDILFKNEQPVKAVPGGSVYNSIISLGRMGVDASFISEVGDDKVGGMILSHLRDSGVDASAVCNVFHNSLLHVHCSYTAKIALRLNLSY